MKLDHVCIAVRSIATASSRLCQMLGYKPRTDIVENTRQLVRVQFLKKEDSIDLKLIEPTSKESPIVSFVQKGGGLHHLCFRTDDSNQSIEVLCGYGAKLVTKPEPGEAFNDHPISFLYLGHGLNIELIDTDERRAEV